MTPRGQLHVAILLIFCAVATVAADEPRLTAADVRRASDAAARQQGYDLKTYTRGEATYDPVSKTWGINYRLKSAKPDASGEEILSVEVNDTTGFTSTRFWLATPTPAPPPEVRSTSELIFFFCELAGGVLLAFVPFDRTHTRARWARVAFLLTALLLLFVATSELLRHYHVWTLSPQMAHGFSYTLATLRGVILGLLLALMFSRELTGRKLANDDRPNQTLQPTAGRADV